VLGSGQAIVADVFGTHYYSVSPDGGELAVPQTHLLTTITSFPATEAKADYTDLVIDTKLKGCVANRYDVGAGDAPSPDVDVGTVTFTGYNVKRLASSGVNTFATPPVPATTQATRTGNGYYWSTFGTGTPNATSIAGAPSSVVPFRTLPLNVGTPNFTGLCSGLGGCGPLDCDQTRLGANTCEQTLFSLSGNPDGGATSQAQVAVPGGGGYDPAPATGGTPSGPITVPRPITITSIKVGGVEAGGTPKLLGDLKGKLDPTKEIVIEWSCDGTLTKGAGCVGGAFLPPHVLVTAQTSTNVRSLFASPAATKYGTLSCFSPSETGSLTITAQAVSTLLGTQTNTGSIRLLIVHAGLKAYLLSTRRQLHGAGNGDFAFFNLP
jgi:hypothetical protein